MHQTMLQGLPTDGDVYKAKALESSKKIRKMSRPGDWICKSCRRSNFLWRQSCRRCQKPRPKGYGSGSGAATGCWVRNFQPGDWFCSVAICQAHNFASRWICFKCGAAKNAPSFGGSGGFYHPMSYGFHGRRGGRISRRGWRSGDWFCGRLGCNAHNYGTRVRCFRCNSSRELVGDPLN